MIKIISAITFPGKSPKGMATAFKDARIIAMRKVGETWHKKMLPVHFTTKATGLYGYAQRTEKYQRRKVRLKHHNKPLVFTGALQRALQGVASITASNSGVRVKMSGPKWLSGYISFKGRLGTGPDKKKEITTIAQSEGESLAKTAYDVFKKAVNSAKGER